MKRTLEPTLDDLRMRCVLVQAWKKTVRHIRQHGWYSDTLEIDYQSLRLPDFIDELRAGIESPSNWEPTPVQVVPAPKSQEWSLQGNIWAPISKEKITLKLRPLAHVDLKDQVLATAIMMCLADRVETEAGDPRLTPKTESNRKKVLSYGHRLFCDADSGRLVHRWGSSKTYREFYHDYQEFLERPRIVAENAIVSHGTEIAIVHSDLSKFYDRVRPALLHEKIQKLSWPFDDPNFFLLTKRAFNWTWHDLNRARAYGEDQHIEGFELLALPQGLVAAGFFANVVLRDFASTLKAGIDSPLKQDSKTVLLDACFYVDDLRLVLRVDAGRKEAEIEMEVCEWLQSLLDGAAPGLKVEPQKTKATIEGREHRFRVRQSRVAKRIQADASATFDMLHGTELIGAIEGFFHTQQRYSAGNVPERAGLLVGVSDMRDETAARFSAGKYRKTFRSLRPLLGIETVTGAPPSTDDQDETTFGADLILSREQLDEKAHLFAATLIEEWVHNPSNVRLLRIALDLYPDAKFLESILEMLRSGWQQQGNRGAHREVRLYCLAELFRAGATETGIVSDSDCLPSSVSIDDYHVVLQREAIAIYEGFRENPRSSTRFPWYLMQQVYLYALSKKVDSISPPEHAGPLLLARYHSIFRVISGNFPANVKERATLVALAASAFGRPELLDKVAATRASPDFLRALCLIAPELAIRLWKTIKETASPDQAAASRSLGLAVEKPEVGEKVRNGNIPSLTSAELNPFWDEENVLILADYILSLPPEKWLDLSPWDIRATVYDLPGAYFGRIDGKSITLREKPHSLGIAELFSVPDWCEDVYDVQRQKLGILLRYAIRGNVGFYGPLPNGSQRPNRYRASQSHWEQQRFSGFQGRSSFGPPSVPISSALEGILFQLLRWPGSGVSDPPLEIDTIKKKIGARLKEIKNKRGPASQLMFLEQAAPWPDKPPRSGEWERPLRIGIVQSILPSLNDFKNHPGDLELSQDSEFRNKHRQHLAALIEGVGQMLRVRETHRRQERADGRVLDLLVLPELAVHPSDVDTLLVPFVRAHKCMLLCGLVYHREVFLPETPLVNSCLWLVPEWNRSTGFQIRRFEQGKQHLACPEQSITNLVPFRPVQWLIEYQWHSNTRVHRPLVLSASVCYDATDLALASDLKKRSDFYIVCALNQDVGTFDRMAEGLHYHMFQGVMVVNNGQFGGTNLFMPFKETYHRQVLHLHGQPQATIAFAEVSPRKLTNRPDPGGAFPEGEWKTKPADWSPVDDSSFI